MFSKSTLFFAFLAVSKLAIATPPACLLAAVNTHEEPSDIAAICGSDSPGMQRIINRVCNGNLKRAAMDAYVSICEGEGHTVRMLSSSSSSVPESTSISSPSSSAEESSSTGRVTQSNEDSETASDTATESASETATDTEEHTGHTMTVTPEPTTATYTTATFDSDCSCTRTGTITSVETPTGGFVTVIPTGTLGETVATPTGTGAAAINGAGKYAAGLVGFAGILAAL
ncbi:hypothetical protein M501DRAFT_990691 [Patellaria atrata CBS 101060]|uniref:GPI anchored cell wall protein n=1 Tax=Patellaria atrata CBS 101060 TaxID=1346257 RepID=A0A9P4VPD8_9PEZI|nr:hypothetical protein M501DRAFT_990691 [Patellaria atrata CBS 101060]